MRVYYAVDVRAGDMDCRMNVEAGTVDLVRAALNVYDIANVVDLDQVRGSHFAKKHAIAIDQEAPVSGDVVLPVLLRVHTAARDSRRTQQGPRRWAL